MEILKLAANDVRLKILYLLSIEDQLCPCDLDDILDMSIPAVYQHLHKLKDGRLVKTKRDGQVIFYSLNPIFKKVLSPSLKQIKDNTTLEVLAAFSRYRPMGEAKSVKRNKINVSEIIYGSLFFLFIQ